MRFSVGGIFSVWKGEPGNKKFCGTFHNHVTDYGMNTMVTKSLSALTATLHVGSGNAPPMDSDLTLENEIVSTTNTSTSATVRSAAKGYIGYKRQFEFSAGQAEGTLSELGLSDGVSLFNRQLFLDHNGNPTTVEVSSSEELSILCEVRMYGNKTGKNKTNMGQTTIGSQTFDHNFGMCDGFWITPSYSGDFYFLPENPINHAVSNSRWIIKHSLSDYTYYSVNNSNSTSTNPGGTYPTTVLMKPYVNNSFEINLDLLYQAAAYVGQIDTINFITKFWHGGYARWYYHTHFELGLSPGYNMYSETEWQPSTSYNLNDMFIPEIGDEFIYKVTTAGTSHTEAPTWPTTIGETVTCSGGVGYECVAPLLVIDDTEALTLTIKISWTRE